MRKRKPFSKKKFDSILEKLIKANILQVKLNPPPKDNEFRISDAFFSSLKRNLSTGMVQAIKNPVSDFVAEDALGYTILISLTEFMGIISEKDLIESCNIIHAIMLLYTEATIKDILEGKHEGLL